MTRTSLFGSFLLALGVIVTGFVCAQLVRADQDYFPPGASANFSRPCNPEGATLQNVSVSATSARTTNATAAGTVRVFCTQDAYMTTGASAPTATTSHIPIGGFTPEYFYLQSVKVAFIRSTADGTCQVMECK